MRPQTRIARCDTVNVACQTFGQGPDLVLCPGWVSNVEYGWEIPEWARFHEDLGRFARVTLRAVRCAQAMAADTGAAEIAMR